jgi:hypothetical protein
MNEHWTPADLHRLHDAARIRAHRLRAEAFSDFWVDLHVALDKATDQAGRAARRLASAMRRHEGLRGVVSRPGR